MIAHLDGDRCTGHALCNAAAPDLFALDDTGYCAVGDLAVPVGLEKPARDGVAACPEGALAIRD